MEKVPAETKPTELFNVMLSRKLRGKNVETKYFSLEVPLGVDAVNYILPYIRQHYPGWILGGCAPAKVAKPK